MGVGLCSYCRRRPAPRQVCHLCGDLMTNHESGLCYRCRRGKPEYDKSEEVIKHHKREVEVLELRKKGHSFASIADHVGCSKSTAYETYRKALQMSLRDIYQEEV